MKTELEKYKLFLELLDCGLKDCVPALPEDMKKEEWEFLYATAKRHAVQGLIYDALEKVEESSIPGELAAKWALEVSALEKNYDKVSRIGEAQRRTWKEHGIGASILKGCESAKYYANPKHRVMGDIDWWFYSTEDWDAALEVLEEKKIKYAYDSDGDLHYEIEGTVIEHHRKGYEIAGPCGELLLLNKHILHHAMVAGVGMRQICDYKAALEYFKGQYDPTEYENILEEQGLSKWTEILEEMPEEFLGMVLQDGNFGLDKKKRFSGLLTKAVFFLPIAPTHFMRCWWGLLIGRLKRK